MPTDFSDCARHAVRVAMHLAEAGGRELTFLHALPLPIEEAALPSDWESRYPELRPRVAEAAEALDEMVHLAEKRGLKASRQIAPVDHLRNLTEAIGAASADLVVMGSHGRSGLRQFIMGSNAERTMRALRTPIMVVRESSPAPRFNRIVFASGMEADTHPAFDVLIRFAEMSGAEDLHFVEVTTPYNFRPTGEVEAAMRAFIEPYDFPALAIHNYVHYTIEAGILDFARSIDADLIAIANHGRAQLTNLFIESIPENLVRFGHLPVLSIRV